MTFNLSAAVVLLLAAIAFGYFVAHRYASQRETYHGDHLVAASPGWRTWLDWAVAVVIALFAVWLFWHPHHVATIFWWLLVALALVAAAVILLAFIARLAGLLLGLALVVIALGLANQYVHSGPHKTLPSPGSSTSAPAPPSDTSSPAAPSDSSSTSPAPSATSTSPSASKPAGDGTAKHPHKVGLESTLPGGSGGFVPGDQLLNDLRDSAKPGAANFRPSYTQAELNKLAQMEEGWIRANASGNKCLAALAKSFGVTAEDLAQYMKDHLVLGELGSSGLTATNTWCTPTGELAQWEVQTFPQHELIWFYKGTTKPAMKYVCGNRLYEVAQPHPSSPTPTPGPSSSTPAPHTSTPSAPKTTPRPTPTPSKTTSKPPVHHSVHLTCQGFEEITGGGKFYLDCVATSDNGAAIHVTATRGNSNITISPTSKTCPSGATCEFTVVGNNDTSKTLQSSIRVVATANGVQDEWSSGTFDVDSRCGGFDC